MNFTFNNDGGYRGKSRSNRSFRAIEQYEMPISMFTKETIKDFLENLPGLEVTDDEIAMLEKLTLSRWKFAAEANGPSSWHHTGKFYNATNHYSLTECVARILEDPAEFEEEYQAHLKASRPSDAEKERRARVKAENALKKQKMEYFACSGYKSKTAFMNKANKMTLEELEEMKVNALAKVRKKAVKLWSGTKEESCGRLKKLLEEDEYAIKFINGERRF